MKSNSGKLQCDSDTRAQARASAATARSGAEWSAEREKEVLGRIGMHHEVARLHREARVKRRPCLKRPSVKFTRLTFPSALPSPRDAPRARGPTGLTTQKAPQRSFAQATDDATRARNERGLGARHARVGGRRHARGTSGASLASSAKERADPVRCDRAKVSRRPVEGSVRFGEGLEAARRRLGATRRRSRGGPSKGRCDSAKVSRRPVEGWGRLGEGLEAVRQGSGATRWALESAWFRGSGHDDRPSRRPLRGASKRATGGRDHGVRGSRPQRSGVETTAFGGREQAFGLTP